MAGLQARVEAVEESAKKDGGRVDAHRFSLHADFLHLESMNKYITKQKQINTISTHPRGIRCHKVVLGNIPHLGSPGYRFWV